MTRQQLLPRGDTADAIDENSGAGQVIYTATADDSADVSDGVTFSLAAAVILHLVSMQIQVP